MYSSISSSEQSLAEKIEEFQKAINKYNNNTLYNKCGIVVAVVIIFLQVMSLYSLFYAYYKGGNAYIYTTITVLLLSYIATDFINGVIHMYMDNNTSYTSVFGPFIAAFHLHHKKPKYKKRHPIKVYFYETGSKFWLLIYMILLIYMQHAINISFNINLCLVSIGVLSSVAEVSHYWCHNSRKENRVINKLQNYGVLLSKDHHRAHHREDNMNYAFLNGVTDPFINIIAACFYDGYKNNADKHVMAYTGKQTNNR